MSVVGIDFGNESCVVAVAKRAKIEVLQNQIGKRKTRNMVAFSDNIRVIGDDAAAQQGQNAKNSVLYHSRMLGKQMDNPELAAESFYIPVPLVSQNGKVAFEVRYDGKKEIFAPQQITASMMGECKKIAEAGLENQRVTDCVISCPTYWTGVERKAMMDSAKIAGLNVLRLMNDTTAIALQYGILRPMPKDEAKKVCFVDIGATSTQVAIASFVTGKLHILGTACDRHLGGRDFDRVLMTHFAQVIKDKYKLDVMSNIKATGKLAKECNRVKHILSANTQVKFTVEYIMNDTDVISEITRLEFEALCAKEILARIAEPCKLALLQAGIGVEDLSDVEITGGATRVPCVQAALTEFFGKPMSKTCDSDESIARGCTLQCAMISPSFKVREFEVHDITSYPVEVAWTGGSGDAVAGDAAMQDEEEASAEGSSQELFSARNPMPSVKIISFTDRTEPFTLEASYGKDAILPPGTDRSLGTYEVSGMPKAVDGEKPGKIKVRVKLDLHGLVEVTGAQLVTTVEEEVEVQVPVPMETEEETVKEDKPEEAVAGANDAKAEDGGKEAMTDEPAEAELAKEEAPKEEKDEAVKVPEVKMMTKKEKKKRTIKSDLKVKILKSNLTSSEKEVAAMFEREASMLAQDRSVAETNDARNSLEGYVLEMRSKLESELRDYILPPANEAFCKVLMEMEDWLMDEEGAQKSEYKAKLVELKKTGDPVEKRHSENSRREEFTKDFRSNLKKWVELANTTESKYAHITPEERKGVTDCVSETEKWLEAQLAAQEALPKHHEPLLVTSKILQTKISEVVKKCTPIMSKKKPEPKKEEPKKEEPKEDMADDKAAEEQKPATADGDKPVEEEKTSTEEQEAAATPSKMEEAD